MAKSKKRYITPSEIKVAGAEEGYKEIELQLNEESELGWIKYIPLSTRTVFDMQSMQIKEGDEKDPQQLAKLTKFMQEALQKSLLHPDSTKEKLILMYTPETISDDVAFESIPKLIEILTGGVTREGEKKALETAPEQLPSSDSQDSAEPGTSDE